MTSKTTYRTEITENTDYVFEDDDSLRYVVSIWARDGETSWLVACDRHDSKREAREWAEEVIAEMTRV